MLGKLIIMNVYTIVNSTPTSALQLKFLYGVAQILRRLFKHFHKIIVVLYWKECPQQPRLFLRFWTTVCKMVRPVVSNRCLSVCLYG